MVVWQGQVRGGMARPGANDLTFMRWGSQARGCVLGEKGVGGEVSVDTFSMICGGQVRRLPFEGILAMP